MKILLIVILLFITIMIYGQELNGIAKYIKENHTVEYTQIIKKAAIDKWENDNSMILYEINKQSKALEELILCFESEHTDIFILALLKWSYEDKININVKLATELEYINIQSLIKFYCNWEMVKYEYDNEVKAKNAY